MIDAERERLPERVFRQEYDGEFLEGSGSVFRNVRECATGSFKDPVKNEKYYGGLDLAKVEDYTVLVILNAKRDVVYVDRFHRIDWALQVVRIKTAVERYGKARINIDSTGAGEPIFESLRRENLNIWPYPFTAKSKAALVDNLSLLFERREITLPKPEIWPDGIDEIESFQYSITDSGSVRSSAPSGFHDDIVIALGLAAWNLRPVREFRREIGIGIVPFP